MMDNKSKTGGHEIRLLYGFGKMANIVSPGQEFQVGCSSVARRVGSGA